VGAGGGVHALIGQAKALDGPAAEDVALHDFVHIGLRHTAVPHGIRVDDNGRTVLALVQTTRFVGADTLAQSALGQRLLEGFLQVIVRIRIAAAPRMARLPLIAADEDVTGKWGHAMKIQRMVNDEQPWNSEGGKDESIQPEWRITPRPGFNLRP
jgi:hypothetical protein